jgi:hypothetical protein
VITKEELEKRHAEANRVRKLPEDAAALAFAHQNNTSGPACSVGAAWKGWRMDERLLLEDLVDRLLMYPPGSTISLSAELVERLRAAREAVR